MALLSQYNVWPTVCKLSLLKFSPKKRNQRQNECFHQENIQRLHVIAHFQYCLNYEQESANIHPPEEYRSEVFKREAKTK